MAPRDQWRQEGEGLVRDLELDDFKVAMAFVNRAAD
jgi:pterin-4a-carbinolamine dehydratase